MNTLSVVKTLADVESELARLRKRHICGAAKKLAEAKRIRTAMLRAELDHGLIHVRPHVKSKPSRRQTSFQLEAA